MLPSSESGADSTATRSVALGLWAPLLLGLVIAFFALEWVRVHIVFDTETAGAAAYTTSVFGKSGGLQVHCQDRRDTQKCITDYRASGSPPAVLWLGNSQLHSINRFRPGQETASQILHAKLTAEGMYLVTYSQPNANLTEHQILFRQLKKEYKLKTLVLPVCLDDFRESGVRPTIGDAVVPGGQAPPPTQEQAFSPQTHVEAWLLRNLGQHWTLWRFRPAIKGLVDYAAYASRNLLLGINAQTKRPVSAGLYSEKMKILREILGEAKASGVPVVLYVPPYRQDVSGPYVASQYEGFVRDLERLSDGDQVHVVDLTRIVPGPEWGMLKDPLLKVEDYDFMHFTADGHRRLASELEKALR